MIQEGLTSSPDPVTLNHQIKEGVMTTVKEAISEYLDDGGDPEYLDTLIAEALNEWEGTRTFEISAYSFDSWAGAAFGYYWGTVDGYGNSVGDSVGPFETREESQADMEKSQNKG
jgi:hypothetical protein